MLYHVACAACGAVVLKRFCGECGAQWRPAGEEGAGAPAPDATAALLAADEEEEGGDAGREEIFNFVGVAGRTGRKRTDVGWSGIPGGGWS